MPDDDLDLIVPNSNDPNVLRRSLLSIIRAIRKTHQLASGSPVYNDDYQLVRNDDNDVIRVEVS